MQKQSCKVVWSHPKGRFDVLEISGLNVFGQPYSYREARLTPEKRTDCRNHHVDVLVFKPARRNMDKGEQQRVLSLYKRALSVAEIAKMMGRSEHAVRNTLRKEGLV